jgi:hypothetical protein
LAFLRILATGNLAHERHGKDDVRIGAAMTQDDLHALVGDLRQKVDDLEHRFSQEFDAVRAEIRAEGETTQRHFNVMVEKVEAAVRIVAEGHVHLRIVLDNHEVRRQAIDKRV